MQAISLPEMSYPCEIKSYGWSKLKSDPVLYIHDTEYSIRCKLSSQAQQTLFKHVQLNQDITSFEGLRISLISPVIRFSLKQVPISEKLKQLSLKMVPLISLQVQ